MMPRRLAKPPSLASLYAKAAITARGRHGDRLPEVSYELADVAVDRERLANYQEVCGFRHSDVLPPTFPHVLGFPLATLIMVDPAFPFPLPGMVHVNNTITQQRPLQAGDRLTVWVRAENLREHPRGRQFDMITEATSAGERVWLEVSTYLRRERKSSPSLLAGEGRGGGQSLSAIWRVARNIGRRYAKVSGDVNPIHLNPLAARVFGFPRAIAHGMWLKARCLAALEGRLSDQMTAEVEFKSPLLLPSTVALTTRATEGGWSIGVADSRSGRPHLTGHIHTH